MALILTDGRYLKLELSGKFIIYKNKVLRNKEKKATSFEQVIQKYTEILNNLDEAHLTQEQAHYLKGCWERRDLFKVWIAEYNLYCANLNNGITTGHYPLMQQYIPDVDNTIFPIDSTGYIYLPKLATVKEAYNYAKNSGIFGNPDQLKDA